MAKTLEILHLPVRFWQEWWVIHREGIDTIASEQSQRKQAIVLLRDTGGNQLGSGVLMAETNGGYWLATNRHVVEEQKAVCVQTVDRRVITALVLPPAKAAASAELDLALLWMPAAGANRLAVAYTGPTSTPATALPLVIATGYPSPLQLNPEDPNYTEDSGLLVPLLKQPLQGGFDLAYTSEVQKGMRRTNTVLMQEWDCKWMNRSHSNC